jgi:hypothetical protein
VEKHAGQAGRTAAFLTDYALTRPSFTPGALRLWGAHHQTSSAGGVARKWLERPSGWNGQTKWRKHAGQRRTEPTAAVFCFSNSPRAPRPLLNSAALSPTPSRTVRSRLPWPQPCVSAAGARAKVGGPARRGRGPTRPCKPATHTARPEAPRARAQLAACSFCMPPQGGAWAWGGRAWAGHSEGSAQGARRRESSEAREVRDHAGGRRRGGAGGGGPRGG